MLDSDEEEYIVLILEELVAEDGVKLEAYIVLQCKERETRQGTLKYY